MRRAKQRTSTGKKISKVPGVQEEQVASVPGGVGGGRSSFLAERATGPAALRNHGAGLCDALRFVHRIVMVLPCA